jgi:hypothetical protein
MPTTVTVFNNEPDAVVHTYQVAYTAGMNDGTNNRGYARTVIVNPGVPKVIPVVEDAVHSLNVDLLA